MMITITPLVFEIAILKTIGEKDNYRNDVVVAVVVVVVVV